MKSGSDTLRHNSRKLILFRFGLVLVFILILLLLEVFSRIVFPNVDTRQRQIYGLLYCEKDEQLFWKLRPGFTIREPKSVTISGDGFRVNPLENSKFTGRIRIVCMGDSVTFGWGVHDWEAYPAQLQTILDRWYPGQFEVINAGVPGYSTFQAIHYFDQRILGLAPDLIIAGYGINDNRIRDWRFYGKSEEEIWEMQQGSFNRLRGWLEHIHLYRLLRYAHHRLYLMRFFAPDNHAPKKRVPPQDYEQNMAKLMGKFKQHDIRYILFTEPIARPFPGFAEYVNIIRAFSREHGIPLCDGITLFNCERILRQSSDNALQGLPGESGEIPVQKINPELRHLFGQDPLHPNDDGFTIIARCLFEKIEALYINQVKGSTTGMTR